MFNNNKFQDLLKFFPHDVLKNSVERYKGNRYVKNFSCYNQLVVMLYAQFSGSNSLRDIVDGYNPHGNSHYHLQTGKVCRSTLSHANSKRDYRIFLEPAMHLMSMANSTIRKEFGDIIRIVDSSPISLTGRWFDDWTKDNKTNRTQGLKLHVEYDLGSKFLTKASLSAANVNDVTEVQKWEQESGTTYVLDKGYCDYNWWWKMRQNNAFFVTRAKKNAAIETVKVHTVSCEEAALGIISDEVIIFKNKSPRGGKKNLYSDELRRIVVARPDKETPLVLITNRSDLKATQVAELYKQRWQIELLFKCLKQNLKIKKFVGSGENAVKIQIITAIIAYMLLMLLKKASRSKVSMHTFLNQIKTKLFHRGKKYCYQKNWRKLDIVNEKQIRFVYE